MAILLVDDNETALEVERMMLEANGVNVETASNGARAVEMAKNDHYALIIMDICMPDMNGFEAARKIRSFDSAVPILALAAEDITQDDPDFIGSGMNGIMKKPISVKALRQVFAEYLNITHSDLFKWNRERDTLFEHTEFFHMVGDADSAQRILYRFLTEHENDCERLRQCIENNDLDTAHEILHDIIGISGNLSCHRLYETASMLDVKLRMSKTDSFYIFNDVWNDTVASISEHCQTLLQQSESKEVPVVGSVEWEALLSEFEAYAGEFDSEITVMFNRYASSFEKNLPKELYEELKRGVNRYDYLKVQELMEAYRNA